MADQRNGLYGLVIECTAKTPISFPNFPGIALRGGLGHFMKKSVCVARKNVSDCRGCVLAETCVYARAFESPGGMADEVMPRATNVPHPFSLSPLFGHDRPIAAGEVFLARLSLFGEGIAHLPYFIYSLAKLGEAGIGKSRGRFLLSGIVNTADGRRVFDIGQGFSREPLRPVRVDSPLSVFRLRIDFITPCKIMHEKRETADVSFPSLLRTVLRRLAILSSLYGFEFPDADREGILAAASGVEKVAGETRWEKNERYSRRQGRAMVLRGFTGHAVYEGDITPFYPYLKLAEVTNIGKNTSFGYGAVSVEAC